MLCDFGVWFGFGCLPVSCFVWFVGYVWFCCGRLVFGWCLLITCLGSVFVDGLFFAVGLCLLGVMVNSVVCLHLL